MLFLALASRAPAGGAWIAGTPYLLTSLRMAPSSGKAA